LEGEWAPEEGATVHFLIRQEKPDTCLDTLFANGADSPEARFLCLPQDESVPKASNLSRETESEDCVILQNKFIAASEGGFLLDDGRSLPGLRGIWRCTTPHMTGSISFTP